MNIIRGNGGGEKDSHGQLEDNILTYEYGRIGRIGYKKTDHF